MYMYDCNSGYCEYKYMYSCSYCNRFLSVNSLKPAINSHKLQATNTPLVTQYQFRAVAKSLLLLLLLPAHAYI